MGMDSGLIEGLGGILGNVASQGDVNSANDSQLAALNAILGVNAPTIQDLQVQLQNYQNAGNLSPNAIGTVNQGNSQMGNITTDPRLMAAQMNALGSLQSIGQGGLRPQDMAALKTAMQQSQNQNQAQNAATMQNMQQRGIGGAGAELAAHLSNNQNAANSSMNAGLNIAGQANQAALQGLAGAGNLGNQIQQAQFGQQAQQASAQDIINRFNAANQQQVLGANVGNQNAAQQYNLSNAQQISNANTGVQNQQTMYNAQAPQTVFNDQMAQAGAVHNAYNQQAQNYWNNANRTQGMYTGVAQGIGQGMQSDQNMITGAASSAKAPNADGSGGAGLGMLLA